MPWIIFLFLFTSCSHFSLSKRSSLDEGDAKFHFEEASRLNEEGRYQKALDHLKKLRREYIYSEYSDKVSVMLGDVYFKQKKYKEASLAYERHLSFYPTVRRDYVLYSLGMSYKKQLPKRVDQDLNLSEEVLDYFDLIQSPEYKEKALKERKDIEERLAQKALKAIQFFKKTGSKKIALKRVKDFVDRYPGSEVFPQVLKIGYEVSYDLKEDGTFFKDKLLKDYPVSPEAEFVQSYEGPTSFQKFRTKVL